MKFILGFALCLFLISCEKVEKTDVVQSIESVPQEIPFAIVVHGGAGTIKKEYMTLVLGHLSPLEGAIEGPIGRHPKDRKKMAIVSTGREARTFYAVQQYVGDCTLLLIAPETGRTHQIRVHLSSIGHPVVGDSVYGGKSKLLKRQFLHACKLGFRLPGNGEYMEFKSGLPEDLKTALAKA